MKTEVLMKRTLFGQEITQKSKSEFFSATDLVRAGNKWRRANDLPPFNFSLWLRTAKTKEFIQELTLKFGDPIIMGRGRKAQTWVHPLLFIDIALAISPRLKIEVYGWIVDNLLKYRNYSGDSYKKMCGNLYARHLNKRTFPDLIQDVARRIRAHCGVTDWQHASEFQLKTRDQLHENIALLADVLNNNDTAIRLAFEQIKK
jgi:hypothetical protein